VTAVHRTQLSLPGTRRAGRLVVQGAHLLVRGCSIRQISAATLAGLAAADDDAPIDEATALGALHLHVICSTRKDAHGRASRFGSFVARQQAVRRRLPHFQPVASADAARVPLRFRRRGRPGRGGRSIGDRNGALPPV